MTGQRAARIFMAMWLGMVASTASEQGTGTTRFKAAAVGRHSHRDIAGDHGPQLVNGDKSRDSDASSIYRQVVQYRNSV